MASKKAYSSKSTILTISASSKVSVQIGTKFFTLEYAETRSVPNEPGVNIEEERKILWDAVNTEVDAQIEDVYNTYDTVKKKSRKK